MVSKQQRRQRKLPAWIWVAGGSIVLTFWVVVVWLLYQGGQVHGKGMENNIEGVVIFSNPGRAHSEEAIAYNQDVPVGGEHGAIWLNCGIYDRPVSKENVVHSLEHGAVWLAYRPDLPSDQVEVLRHLTRQQNRRLGNPYVILAPKIGLDAPIVATAWQVQLKLESATDERLVQFLRQYWKGLFTPEPEKDCTDGTGQPIDD
ncbi:MAG: hypothetical protein DPW09_08450 [Anaerolineae bacterium]|nr:hypothetical protein [Anaerolineae bacterium]